ncbi:hypothetical protein TNCV_2281341 [Trichonephila clavipes]|nr:hypothetical protein TNCV_2281341 [Trichonephila clavipes]
MDSFKRMDNLKRHHLKAHGQPFKIAASTSSSESGRMPHPEKDPTTSFICPVCDKNCSTIHELIRHLKIHASYGKDAAAPSTSNENNTEFCFLNAERTSFIDCLSKSHFKVIQRQYTSESKSSDEDWQTLSPNLHAASTYGILVVKVTDSKLASRKFEPCGITQNIRAPLQSQVSGPQLDPKKGTNFRPPKNPAPFPHDAGVVLVYVTPLLLPLKTLRVGG